MSISAPGHALYEELAAPFAVTPEHVAFFKTNGYIKLKHVLSPAVIHHYGREISRKVRELNTMHLPMEERSTYQKAFLQVTNIWTKSETVKEFIFAKRLAKIAADLMKVRGVRLYHDQALYKEPAGGVTPWHADQFYWPVDSDNTITVWIPLQATPLELGPLAFSVGSQRYNTGRDIEISDESEKKISKALLEQGLPLDETPFDLGEVSYHLGWTFHRAGPNKGTSPREVMTIIYIDKDAKIAKPKNKAQQTDLEHWFQNAPIGSIPNSPLNPILFSYDP